jgi:hypothetical protein
MRLMPVNASNALLMIHFAQTPIRRVPDGRLLKIGAECRRAVCSQKWSFSLSECYGDIEVFYDTDLDGGGREFGQDYLCEMNRLYPGKKPGRIYEWCSGPGFIGFSMLAEKMCSSLCLADVNPKAVSACMQTIERNDLQDRVSIYLSDSMRAIPASEKWDLVVGNPPHSKKKTIYPWGPALLYQDIGWKVHRSFYREVGRFQRLTALSSSRRMAAFPASRISKR